MLTSDQIAQAIASQNQQFMGQRAFAQSVGVGPAPFSYAPSRFSNPGFGSGNAFAGRAMSAAGSAVGAATGAFGMASGLAGAAELGMWGAGALGMGGAAAPMLGGLAALSAPLSAAALPVAAIGAGANAFVHGGQQQQAITNQLGAFNFYNPSSRTGAGFNRDDAMAIGHSVRQLAYIPEMMTSVEELTKLMPKLKQSGVMQGVKDASEFASRFKESVKTIRDISRIMGSTMDEAEQFFSHSHAVGFLGRQAQIQNVLNAQFTSGMTGMSTGQVMQMQMAGANLATQFGTRRSLGAGAVTNIAQTLGAAQQQGLIRDGLLEDITGLEGSDAVQAASQKFAGVVANLARNSPAGRLSIAGLAKFDESGKAVGLDDDLVRRYRNGGLSREDLMRRAGSLTNAQKISFTARQNDLAMEFAMKGGPGGISQFLQNVAGDQYGSEGVNLILQRQGGLSSQEADAFQSVMGVGGLGQDFEGMARIRARESSLRERTSPDAIMRRLKTRIKAATTGHIEEAGAKIFNEMGKAYDEFIDDLVGRHAITLSKNGADSFARAMSGGGGKDLFRAIHGLSGLSGPSGMTGMDAAKMIGAGLTGPVPGVGLLSMGFTQGGRDTLGRFAKSLRDSDIGAFLMRDNSTTGRGEEAQFAHMADLLGGKSSMGAAVNILSRGVRGAEGASGDLERLKRGIENFSSMTDARKLDELRGSVAGSLGAAVSGGNQYLFTQRGQREVVQALSEGDVDKAQALASHYGVNIDQSISYLETNGNASGKSAARLIRAGLAAQRAGFKGDFATGIALSQKGGGTIFDINAKNLFNRDVDLLDPRSLERARSKAVDQLSAVIGSQAAATISAGGDKGRILQEIAGGNDKVWQALIKSDPEEAARSLQAMGYKVKAEDIKNLQDQGTGVKTAGEKGKQAVSNAMKTFSDVQDATDQAVIRQKARERAGDLANNLSGKTGSKFDKLKALQSALATFGTTTGGPEALQSALSDFASQVEGAKGSEREELLRMAGPEISGALGRAISGGDKLRKLAARGGKTSRSEIASSFGLSEGALKDAFAVAGIGSGTVDLKRMSKGALDAFIHRAEAAAGGAGIAGAGSTSTGQEGSVEQQTLTVLGDLRKSIDLNTSTIAALSRGEKVPDPAAASRENSGSDSKGNAQPGKK